MSIPEIRPPRDNRGLLQEIISRQRRTWFVTGLIVFFVSVVYGLLICPQYFTSSVSISMQQPGASSVLGTLGMLGNTGTKKYVGVLKSRRFAENIEEKVHLQRLYELKHKTDAVDKIMHSARFDDNAADGLIYIDITLDAPPKLQFDARGQREKVRTAAAIVANGYADELRNWIVNQDTEKDSVLLREADVELKRVRKSYDDSIAEMVAYIRSRHSRPPVMISAVSSAAAQASAMSSGSVGGGLNGVSGGGAGGLTAGGDTASSAAQYSTLYARRAQLEVQMRSLDTLRAKITAILSGPLQEVAAIPSEDPLLLDARRQYNTAYLNLQNLTVGLGPQNPQVIQAQGALTIARQRFVNQMKAVLEGHTSDQMRRDVMTTEYDMLNRQIRDQEMMFHDSRELSTQLTLRTNEVALRLKVLETAMQSAEQLKITTVSARNRFAVVDPGIPAERSKPGLLLIAAVSVAIPLLILCILLLIAYMMAGSDDDGAVRRNLNQA